MQPCSLRLRGCSNARDTVVLAHLPSVDKGLGIKSPDHWAVYACSHCHDVLDKRIKTDQPRWEVELRCLPALYETLKHAIQEGLIIVKE